MSLVFLQTLIQVLWCSDGGSQLPKQGLADSQQFQLQHPRLRRLLLAPGEADGGPAHGDEAFYADADPDADTDAVENGGRLLQIFQLLSVG